MTSHTYAGNYNFTLQNPAHPNLVHQNLPATVNLDLNNTQFVVDSTGLFIPPEDVYIQVAQANPYTIAPAIEYYPDHTIQQQQQQQDGNLEFQNQYQYQHYQHQYQNQYQPPNHAIPPHMTATAPIPTIHSQMNTSSFAPGMENPPGMLPAALPASPHEVLFTQNQPYLSDTYSMPQTLPAASQDSRNNSICSVASSSSASSLHTISKKTIRKQSNKSPNSKSKRKSASSSSTSVGDPDSAAVPGSGSSQTSDDMLTVVERDENGVDWIQFFYTKDRIKSTYRIRCDIEKVNSSLRLHTTHLGPSRPPFNERFKKQNCIYPKACVPIEQYKGNRQKYEMECNCIGWCLAYINPELRGQRGLIQRAVDSWRNTNANMNMRSRRVRRLSRQQKILKNTSCVAGSDDPSTSSMADTTSTNAASIMVQQDMAPQPFTVPQIPPSATVAGPLHHPVPYLLSPSPSPNSNPGLYPPDAMMGQLEWKT